MKLNRNNVYKIGTLPAEVGSSSSDAVVGVGWSGQREKEREIEIEHEYISHFQTVTISSWLLILYILELLVCH